jgi:hypothetical protein
MNARRAEMFGRPKLTPDEDQGEFQVSTPLDLDHGNVLSVLYPQGLCTGNGFSGLLQSV